MVAPQMAASQMTASQMTAFDLQSSSLQNSPRRNWMFRQPLLFAYGLPKHPFFLFIHLFPTQSVRPSLITYPRLCSACVTYRTLCHTIGHQVLPTQALPREVEDLEVKIVLSMCLCSHTKYTSHQKIYLWYGLFNVQSWPTTQ